MSAQQDVDTLKRMVLGATRFAPAWDAFFRLSEAPRFMRRSRVVEHDTLGKVLDCVCRSLWQERQRVLDGQAGTAGACAGGPNTASSRTLEHVMLLEYADTGLLHGFLVAQGCPGNFLYFRDEDAGMALLLLPCGQNRMCRFSVARCSGPVPPCLPPAGPGAARLH